MLAGQLMFDGLSMGLVFVILATGLVLITSVNKMLFMAYGMFYIIGAYFTWYAINSWQIPYFCRSPYRSCRRRTNRNPVLCADISAAYGY